MTDQGPATPGTAARGEVCSVCGQPKLPRDATGWMLGQCYSGTTWLDSYNEGSADCFRIGYERLKAENASLLEWKAKAMLRLIGLEPVHDEVAAAEQRAEAAEKERDHFIREAGDWQLFANEQEQRAIAAEARAALHDEERSAPPGPVECMPPYAPHAMVGEDCCLAFSDHMKEPPTAGECCKHHAAAQGEEK